ncbi:MAG: hypothetical protein JST38_16030 [Bacteroidetes bacterium]|nr:hypothetical protein [Bacteroidota bacterium]
MQKRKLGHSDLLAAPWAFGGNVFGWTVDEPHSSASSHLRTQAAPFVVPAGQRIESSQWPSTRTPG